MRVRFLPYCRARRHVHTTDTSVTTVAGRDGRRIITARGEFDALTSPLLDEQLQGELDRVRVSWSST